MIVTSTAASTVLRSGPKYSGFLPWNDTRHLQEPTGNDAFARPLTKTKNEKRLSEKISAREINHETTRTTRNLPSLAYFVISCYFVVIFLLLHCFSDSLYLVLCCP